MNVFNLQDDEFENYLKENVDNVEPRVLLRKLIDCGLDYEEEYNVE